MSVQFGSGLIPRTEFDGSILEACLATPMLSTLVAALKKASLVNAIKGLQHATVIAPSDDAFNDLGFSIDHLLNSPILKEVLLYHVTGSEIDPVNLEDHRQCTHDSLNGTKWIHTDKLVVDAIGRQAYIKRIIVCSNGTVLLVSKVMLPKQLTSKFGTGGLSSSFVAHEFTPGHNHH